MKNKLSELSQKFSRAVIKPVMFMSVAGIIISFAALFKLEVMPTFIQQIGDFMFNLLTNAVIGQFALIFSVGIATALVKKNKTNVAIIGVMSFMIFLYANNSWLTLTNQLAEAGEHGLFGTGQNIVLGIQVTDMGVFSGIVMGCVTGYIFNKFGSKKLPKWLSPYQGANYAFLIMIFVSIAIGIGITYVWPLVNSLINTIVLGISEMGPLGFFVYGVVNRLALPLGLHHLMWMPLYYTPLGGTAVIAGETAVGAYNIWLAELGNISQVTSIHPSVGFIMNFGYTALPIGIALAIIKTAKPENKDKVKAIMYPAIIAAALGGITEPIEFMFLFTAPMLWLVHAVIYGFGLFLSSILGMAIEVSTVINTVINMFVVPVNLGKQYLVPIIFAVLVFLEYFAFKFFITKFDIKTIGRTDDENEEIGLYDKNAKKVEGAAALEVIIDGLGGPDNIKNLSNCYSRLRIDVHDDSLVSEELLNKYQNMGIIRKENHVQIIIGADVEHVRADLDTLLENL